MIYNKRLTDAELRDANIFIDQLCNIDDGVEIEANVVIKNSTINKGCKIGINSNIENSVIHENVKILSSFVYDCEINCGSTIGPFAHIRNNSIIGANNRIGNFVEIKKSVLGSNCKVAHLTYVGDAEIGNNCNVGCGVVFCNYNGKIKQKVIVGNNVFIGSNVNLVAPLRVEDCAYIAAGSTITNDVKDNTFAIARARQEIKNNFKNPYIN